MSSACVLISGLTLANAETTCSNASGNLQYISASGSGDFAMPGGYRFSVSRKVISMPEQSNDVYDVVLDSETQLSSEEIETKGGRQGPMLMTIKNYAVHVKISRKDGESIHDSSMVDGPKWAIISDWVICKEIAMKKK